MGEESHDQSQNDAERRKRSRNIGSKLRKLYEDVTEESVPDEFLRILEEADKKQDGCR